MICSENQISLMESNTRDVICPWASELYSTPQFFGWRLVWMEKWFLFFIRHKNSFSDTNLRWSEHGQTLLGKMRFCWLLRQLVDKTQFISWLWTFTSWLLFKKKILAKLTGNHKNPAMLTTGLFSLPIGKDLLNRELVMSCYLLEHAPSGWFMAIILFARKHELSFFFCK